MRTPGGIGKPTAPEIADALSRASSADAAYLAALCVETLCTRGHVPREFAVWFNSVMVAHVPGALGAFLAGIEELRREGGKGGSRC